MLHFDDGFRNWLLELRRDLHRHPELAYQETWTTARISAELEALGLEVKGFEGMTGLVGLLRGGQPGLTLGLRADIDGLPLEEATGLEFKSLNPGRMHACGHDANAAIMIGVARYLIESGLAKRLKGQIKFLFQPAEEAGAGALKMIEAGVLEDPPVDRLLAGHMSPETPVGQVGVYQAQGYASADRFRLVVRGRGGHGGRPHEAADPILAAAHFITALQSVVARNVDPLEAAVLSVCRINAGTVSNVIPEEAELEGTIRALAQPVRQLLHRRLAELAQSLEPAFGVKGLLEIFEGYPICVNDQETAAFIYQVAADVLGPDKVAWARPVTGAEDFAYFAQRVPSAIIRLGSRNEERGIIHPLHSPHFDLDEEVLLVGVTLFSEAARRFLG